MRAGGHAAHGGGMRLDGGGVEGGGTLYVRGGGAGTGWGERLRAVRAGTDERGSGCDWSGTPCLAQVTLVA